MQSGTGDGTATMALHNCLVQIRLSRNSKYAEIFILSGTAAFESCQKRQFSDAAVLPAYLCINKDPLTFSTMVPSAGTPECAGLPGFDQAGQIATHVDVRAHEHCIFQSKLSG